MATDDYRRRRGFFPATYGSGYGSQGFGPGSGLLAPEDNPAYQAAIAKGRPNMNNYSWITTPSGGQMRVPTGSIDSLVKPNTALSGSFVNPATGPLSSQQYAANKAQGYGAPNPTFNPGTGTLSAGGVEAPVEGLTPQQRVGIPGTNPFLDKWASNFRSQNPTLGAIGSFAYNALQGLRSGFNNPQTQQYANNVSTGQIQPQQNQASVSQPRRYFDPDFNYGF